MIADADAALAKVWAWRVQVPPDGISRKACELPAGQQAVFAGATNVPGVGQVTARSVAVVKPAGTGCRGDGFRCARSRQR